MALSQRTYDRAICEAYGVDFILTRSYTIDDIKITFEVYPHALATRPDVLAFPLRPEHRPAGSLPKP